MAVIKCVQCALFGVFLLLSFLLPPVDWSAEGGALYDVAGIDRPLRTPEAQAAIEAAAHRPADPTFTLAQCLEVRRPCGDAKGSSGCDSTLKRIAPEWRAGPTFTLHQCLEVRRPLTASLAAHAWQVAAHFCPASCASLCMASLPLLGQVLGAAGLSWQHTRLSAALLVREGACAA